ncbi:MAG TPA: cysteine peptidase family C39 domain-containing protein [Polyangiaceae bacterium]|jgi:ABC-type bacteriocin/lantibiotic exporter with double-glycine peptidase domain|nr:cysteine peptidase family C39 domain-containing protein [Polyangiaceae bacterium]
MLVSRLGRFFRRERFRVPRSHEALLAIAALSLGCASYKGSSHEVQPSSVQQQGGWVMVPHFPLVMQEGNHDCGAASLSAVLGFWGRPSTPAQIADAEGRGGKRLGAGDIEQYAKSQGFSSYVFYGTMKDVAYELEHGRPVIVGLGKAYEGNKAIAHYEVVVGFSRDRKQVLLLDPGRGWQTDSFDGFAREWSVSKGVTVVTFLRAPDVATTSG